jgi:hypothetical protein
MDLSRKTRGADFASSRFHFSLGAGVTPAAHREGDLIDPGVRPSRRRRGKLGPQETVEGAVGEREA